MKSLLKKLRRRFRKDQAGQSIVLLAFAFIALAAFVGLVTDISILFVRYSTLRRTIDAAAIAASGQIREGTDYGTVALTAKQFIRLHGLEPSKVWVETCETDIAAWRTGTGIFEGQGAHPEGTYPSVQDDMPETELCDWDTPRKLVRVRAQIESETFFLRLIGIQALTLEATAVSETAVLDVALVLDTSQSMSESTEISHYDEAWSGGPYPQDQRPFCFYNSDTNGDTIPDVHDPVVGPQYEQFRYGPCCNDPGNGEIVLNEGTGLWELQPPGGTGPFSAADDGLFDDLICNPFRQVKDAARNFIRRLDYVRGDRVALVTFDSVASVVNPLGADPTADLIMMTNEENAINTLNNLVGVNPQDTSKAQRIRWWGDCLEFEQANQDWFFDNGTNGNRYVIDNTTDNPDGIVPFAYNSVAPCPDTNIGGGIRAANDALTNVVTIRRDAVWVIILLTDGAANRTDVVPDTTLGDYGFYGFCPWYTFCEPEDPTHPQAKLGLVGLTMPDDTIRPECPDSGTRDFTTGYELQFCNDDNPNTRHFCLQWTGDPATNGRPDPANASCSPDPLVGYGNETYDADDYARDWADFAGLINITNNVPGNFIAIFTIGFGERILNEPTSAPLLRYIADAGDNGTIDNDFQQDLRDDGIANGSVTDLGDPGPCQAYTVPADRGEQCGQYYYATDLASLEAVFEAIASRLFTRIAR